MPAFMPNFVPPFISFSLLQSKEKGQTATTKAAVDEDENKVGISCKISCQHSCHNSCQYSLGFLLLQDKGKRKTAKTAATKAAAVDEDKNKVGLSCEIS